MNYNDLHIGKNIEFLLNTSKHKKFEIATMLGISRQQLRLIEKSEDVSTAMLKKIAFVLNIDIMDFVCDFDSLETKYNPSAENRNNNKEDIKNNPQLLLQQLDAYKNENALMKELLKTKDELIKLLTKK
ncbi:helix-turn-helix domain-containing protein [Flavobacterium psychrophilum]